MEVKAPFGFVTSCYSKDVFMVQATLASIKYYCPDVPICLIVDGNVDVAELEREYGLIVLRVADLPSAEMRQLIEGSTRSKLAAMWEGPFEFYVWMDSDAILWGDITPQLRTDVDFQIFWNEISIPADAEQEPPWLSHYYFDIEKLKEFDPDFEWRGHPYFCDGVFACKRGAISFSRWAEVFQWRKHENDPWTKGFNCMPMMNYLVHSLGSRGEINVVWTDLQWVRSRDNAGLVRDCADSDWHFPKEVDRAWLLHFCGRKPYTWDRNCYSRPFTIARLEHYQRSRGKLAAWLTILAEDGRALSKKIQAKLKRIASKG